METKNARIDFLSLDIDYGPEQSKNIIPKEILEKLMKYINALDPKDKKETYILDNQVIFLDNYEIKDENKFLLKFSSVKYNHVRDVLDTDKMTKVPKKKKTPIEGDIENTHVVIHLLPTFIDVYIEYSHNGARESKIFQYLNDKAEKMIEKNTDLLKLNLSYDYYFDKNFLDMLLNKDEKELRKIELLCEDSTDPFLVINGRNEKFKKTIIYQPKDSRISILKSEIKKLYEDFNKKYSRIRVKNSKGATILDTDQLKKKEIIKVKINNSKEIISSSMFHEIEMLIKKAHTN